MKIDTYFMCPRFSILYSSTNGTSLQIDIVTVLESGVACGHTKVNDT